MEWRGNTEAQKGVGELTLITSVAVHGTDTADTEDTIVFVGKNALPLVESGTYPSSKQEDLAGHRGRVRHKGRVVHEVLFSEKGASLQILA